MNRKLRDQPITRAAVVVAMLLTAGFVTANLWLHLRITHWQDGVERGASAIRLLDDFKHACEPVTDLAIAAELLPVEELLAQLDTLTQEAQELAVHPALAPLGAAKPAEQLADAARRLAGGVVVLSGPLAAAPASERAAAGREIHAAVVAARRQAEVAVAAIRHELTEMSLEMHDSNQLAKGLLLVSCGFAVLLVALLWFRQHDLLRLLETDRQRHAADRHLAVVLERAPIIIWSLDRELRFTFLRGAAIPAGAHDAATSMMGRTLAEYFGTDDPACPPLTHHRRALAGEPQSYAVRWQERNFIVHVEPWREGAEITGVLGAAVETTATTRMQAQLAHSRERVRHLEKMEAIGRLADFVAHDFNNFLTVVLGYSGSVLQQLPATAPHRFEVEEIARTAERATWLTRQLLAFSRPTRIEAEAIDLASAVRALAPVLERQCGEAIVVELDLAPAIPPILAHRTQVEQIVLNLAVNARDAMTRGGRLRIAVAHDSATAARPGAPSTESAVVLTVSDTGIGMDEEVRSRIFEPFFSTKADGHGTGLGLAIVDAIVRERGGTIAVDSDSGRGSTFTLRFPAAIGVELDRIEVATAPPPIGRGERVLLVEDDDAVRTLAERTLEAHGYLLTAARGGLEALDRAAAGPPLDLVLTDERMLRISGSELISRLRERQPGLPAILMSSHSGGSAHATVNGEVGFLAKPFTVAELLTTVRSTLDM
ncbi:MAG: response regulator [Planctomycetes bacterium]|nr:response regulator [Planctomycetota bacterium]